MEYDVTVETPSFLDRHSNLVLVVSVPLTGFRADGGNLMREGAAYGVCKTLQTEEADEG